MGKINRTLLTTGTNRSFDSGFPLLPKNTSLEAPRDPVSIGAGYAPRQSDTFLDTSIPLAWFRLIISSSQQRISGFFAGFLLGYTVEGETRNDGTASLQFSSEFMQGGVGVGLGITFNFLIRLDESVTDFSFRDGFTRAWKNLLTFSASATFDILELAVNFLGAVLNIGQLQALSEVKQIASNGAIWGLYATNATPGLSRGSTLELRPRANLSANILELIPKFGAFIKAMSKVGAKFSVGPTLVILFPISLSIVRLTTEDGDYRVNGTSATPGSTTGQRLFNFTGGPRGTLGPTVSSVRITHSHTIGIELSSEIRASFSFLKIVTISAAVRIPVYLDVIGTQIGTLGPYHTRLSGTPSVSQSTPHIELPEVVWG